MGTPQKNGVGGDAFDLYCQFEHGGNYAAAVASVGAKQSVGNAFTGEPLPEGWGAADVLIPFGAAHGGAGAHGPKRYHLQTADEFLSKPPVRWYVRDVMPVNGVAVIYGKSGSGKTFLTLDLMLALLDDQSAEWCGDKIRERPSGVVYLAMEGAFGVRGRVKAWSQDTGRPAPANLRFLEGVPFNLAQPADVQALIDSVNEAIGGQAIVVVDTQAKASAGSDEQTAKDMGVVFAAAERIAHGINGLCITVAHAGKDETKGLRGSSAQTGAADLIMLVSREGDSRSWLIEKNKDGVDGKAGFFTLESLDIGIDEDGDAVSSAIVVHKDKPPVAVKAKRFSPNDQVAVEAFQVARVRAGSESVHLEAWRLAFYERLPADKQDTKKKAFGRCIKSLLDSGTLQCLGSDQYVQAMGAVLPPLVGLGAPPVAASPPLTMH